MLVSTCPQFFWPCLIYRRFSRYPTVKQMKSPISRLRCWVRKTANILNKLSKHSQAKAKQYVNDIWMAETREIAEKAFDLFIKTCELTCPKLPSALRKTGKNSWPFNDFPADHWPRILTTNPVE
jgi:putative transposase